jgi:hypothetical protein
MTEDAEYSVSYFKLRQAVGWVGLLMPAGVRVGAGVFEHVWSTASISAYYYTGMRDVFVASLVLVGALLAGYRTPAKQDGIVATIAGTAAIGIGLFPTEPVFAAEVIRKHPQVMSDDCYFNRGILGFHFLFVGIFFALAFYLVTFRFRALTPANPTLEKLQRNRVYPICGVLMGASFLTIGALALFDHGASIFWPESAAVVAFAVAWIVKGQGFLPDAARARDRRSRD